MFNAFIDTNSNYYFINNENNNTTHPYLPCPCVKGITSYEHHFYKLYINTE